MTPQPLYYAWSLGDVNTGDGCPPGKFEHPTQGCIPCPGGLQEDGLCFPPPTTWDTAKVFAPVVIGGAVVAGGIQHLRGKNIGFGALALGAAAALGVWGIAFAATFASK